LEGFEAQAEFSLAELLQVFGQRESNAFKDLSILFEVVFPFVLLEPDGELRKVVYP